MNLYMLKVVDILRMNGTIPAMYIKGISYKKDNGFEIYLERIFDWEFILTKRSFVIQ